MDAGDLYLGGEDPSSTPVFLAGDQVPLGFNRKIQPFKWPASSNSACDDGQTWRMNSLMRGFNLPKIYAVTTGFSYSALDDRRPWGPLVTQVNKWLKMTSIRSIHVDAMYVVRAPVVP